MPAVHLQLIQRRCQVCGGNGLVKKGKYMKKCPQCGGFFPWISWRMFLSANASPGNGGEGGGEVYHKRFIDKSTNRS